MQHSQDPEVHTASSVPYPAWQPQELSLKARALVEQAWESKQAGRRQDSLTSWCHGRWKASYLGVHCGVWA